MSPSAVSHAVRAVEERLGEPLFARTTRSVSVTEAGGRFLASVGPALDDIGSAVENLTAARGETTGVLRINAPRIAFPMALTAIIARLTREHPGVTVEVHANDAFVDVVGEGFDAGVRLGNAVQQDMVTIPLTRPFQAALVAAPDYIKARGTPLAVADLGGHNLIGFRMLGSGALYEWELKDNGADVSVSTKGSVIVTDSTYARDLALAGVGIAYLYEPLVRSDLRDGRLVWLLRECSVQEDGLFLYFPQRAQLAPKLRAFIDTSKEIGPT